MIDSIRKSLGIESMEDVEMLVDTFYEFNTQKKKRMEEEEAKRLAAKADDQSNSGAPAATNAKDAAKGKDAKGKDGKGKE
jgi:hypothetical protein